MTKLKTDRSELVRKFIEFKIENCKERIEAIKKYYDSNEISSKEFRALLAEATRKFLDKVHSEGEKYEAEVYSSITIGEIFDLVEKEKPGLLEKSMS